MMFVLHIAAFMGLLVTAGGFAVWHLANRERSASLRIAACLLIIGGTLGLACILSYGYIYWMQGGFSALMMPMR